MHEYEPIAIHSAAESSDLEKINELNNKGVDINLIDKQGNTALHIAVNNNYFKRVEYVGKNGLHWRKYIVDSNGNLPLFYAYFNSNQEIVDLLLSKKAILLTDKSTFGDTLWMKAKMEDLESVELFYKWGADLDSLNCDDKKLLILLI